jgi:anti-sigma regulatory factor (Ser/Thr protein kinase)
MMGYELLGRIRELYPETKTALITAWSAEDFINHVLEYNIGNIIAKTVPFNFEELKTTVDKLLSGDIFGLERYMKPKAKIQRTTIKRSDEIAEIRIQIMNDLVEEHFDDYRQMVLRLMLDESITNAAYHAHGHEKGGSFELSEDQAVEVEYGKDDEKIGISVSDRMGTLNQKEILSRLAECIHPTEESLLRESGRGFYLMHSMVDRLVINIKRGTRTEVILLVYNEQDEDAHRPVLIHEI